MNYFKHSTSEVSDKATIGEGTKIWNNAGVREGAIIGKNCILGRGVYIDFDVEIGNNVKIQDRVSVYHGVTIEDHVFIGPHVCFTNDKLPRSVNEDDSIKSNKDWNLSKTLVKKGASIGAGSVILPSIVIGEYVMIGAGSVVTKSIPAFSLAYGNPAKVRGKVNKKGEIIEKY